MKYVEPNDMDENVKILYNLQNSGISVARGATFYAFLHKKPLSDGARYPFIGKFFTCF